MTHQSNFLVGEIGCPGAIDFLPYADALRQGTTVLAVVGHQGDIPSVVLPEDEQARAARYLQPVARQEFILARRFIRGVLGCLLGVPSQEVPLRSPLNRKPWLDHPDFSELDFSISHSAGWVACVLDIRRRVGVDIELSPLDGGDISLLTSKLLAPQDARYLAEQTVVDKVRVFRRLWQKKEALLKAAGVGMFVAPSTFPVCDAGGLLRRVSFWGETWLLAEFAALGQEIAVATALTGADLPIRISKLSGGPKKEI